MHLSVWTDGGARGNPGPAAAGVVIKTQTKELEKFGCFLGRKLTNNQAEYLALIQALQRLFQYQPESVKFHSDSELLVRQLKGEYRVKNPQLKRLFQQAQALLRKIPAHSFHLIPREQNHLADALVNQALEGYTLNKV